MIARVSGWLLVRNSMLLLICGEVGACNYIFTCILFSSAEFILGGWSDLIFLMRKY